MKAIEKKNIVIGLGLIAAAVGIYLWRQKAEAALPGTHIIHLDGTIDWNYITYDGATIPTSATGIVGTFTISYYDGTIWLWPDHLEYGKEYIIAVEISQDWIVPNL